MNSLALPPNELPPAHPLPVEAWRKFLAQCARKPTRKSVHALRSLTLRLRVTLEHRLERDKEPAAAEALRRWKKQGKKLRRRLEPVRDADAYLARLAGLRASLAAAAGGPPSPRCLAEIGELEKRLRQQRREDAAALKTALESRAKRLTRLSKRVEAALATEKAAAAGSEAKAAQRILAGLARELPQLSPANLHAYRRRMKPALYLAENSAAADPMAARMAAAFRKIHLAIGEWHDWQALGLEAGNVLAGLDQGGGLLPVLKSLEEKALRRALGLCRRSTAPFLADSAEQRPSPRRKPVAAAPPARQAGAKRAQA